MRSRSIKKKLSFLVSIALTVLTISAYSNANAVDYLSESREYYVYNAFTGRYSRSYTLSVPYRNNQTNELNSNTPGRGSDNSKTGVVKLFNEDYYLGTGFVVSDHVIATAAHVFQANAFRGSSCDEIKFFDTSGNECASITGRNIISYHIPTGALNEENGTTYDYALIYVNGYMENGVLKDLSDFKCFDLGVMQESFRESTHNNVSITGFPYTENNYTSHNKLTGYGEIIDVTGEGLILEHNISVYGGDSGCPLYTSETVFGREFNTVIGVTAGGAIDYGTAVAINPEILKFYLGNPYINPST